MFTIPITEAHIHGAVSIEHRESALMPWRLPYKEARLFPPDDKLVPRAQGPAGVRVRFQTDATVFELVVKPSAVKRLFDLVVDNKLIQTVVLSENESIARFNLPIQTAMACEVWLPQFHPVEITGINCHDGHYLIPAPDARIRWVTYGSSITQCRTAYSPARTWPGTAARNHNLNLTCLGYGANCHMEPMVALFIRNLPADLITLKVGINIMGGSSLSPRTFGPALIGFVRILRERHPNTPIGVVSPIACPKRELEPNAVGLHLSGMREIISDSVARLAEAGDKHIWYFDGSSVFNVETAERLLADGLHPTPEGYEYLGQRMSEMVLTPLLKQVTQAE